MFSIQSIGCMSVSPYRSNTNIKLKNSSETVKLFACVLCFWCPCPSYLECVDSSIANNGATFQGKSAKGNTGCVLSKMVAVMVVNAAKPPWVEQLDWADEILNFQ